MQRWHLTILLAVQAAIAAAVLPDWTRSDGDPIPSRGPEATVSVLAEDEDLWVVAGLDQSVLPAGRISERFLVLTLDGEPTAEAVARPFNVGVVLDRSGSMASAGKLDFARLATGTLLDSLDERDRFTLVTFSNHAEVQTASQLVLNPRTLRRHLLGLEASGGTNLGAGLVAALEQIEPHASRETLDRVIVLSDGQVNQGETRSEVLAKWAGSASGEGITVSTIGLGLDYNEDLLARLADWGGGTYHFVDNPSDLGGIFEAELNRMTTVAAQGVTVKVQPGPGVQILEVLGYDHSVDANGVRIPIGEIIGGESRKVVLRLRVQAGPVESEQEIAAIRVLRTDGEALAPFSIRALASTDESRIAASIDRRIAVLGAQAEASSLADQAVREWEKGNLEGMHDLFTASVLVSEESATLYGSDTLLTQAKELENNRVSLEYTAPKSTEGRQQAILQKESYRARSH